MTVNIILQRQLMSQERLLSVAFAKDHDSVARTKMVANNFLLLWFQGIVGPFLVSKGTHYTPMMPRHTYRQKTPIHIK